MAHFFIHPNIKKKKNGPPLNLLTYWGLRVKDYGVQRDDKCHIEDDNNGDQRRVVELILAKAKDE